jgi:hypothetical protein
MVVGLTIIFVACGNLRGFVPVLTSSTTVCGHASDRFARGTRSPGCPIKLELSNQALQLPRHFGEFVGCLL